jgi:hypothetical protein
MDAETKATHRTRNTYHAPLEQHMKTLLAILIVFATACLSPAQSCDPRWDTMNGGTNGPINTMARLPNGDIVVGGRFTQAGGVPANNIARWDGSFWHAMGNGLGTEAWRIQVRSNGNVLVWTSGQWTTPNHFAVWIDEWDGISWTRIPITLEAWGGNVWLNNFFVLNDDSLVIFGRFVGVNGQPARNIARLSGSTWSQYGSNADAVGFDIKALMPKDDGSLHAVGWFYFSPSLSSLLEMEYRDDRWRPRYYNDGWYITGWSANAYLVADDGTPYIGGDMMQIGMQSGALASLPHGATGPAMIAATPRGGQSVLTLSRIDRDHILVGGSFQRLGSASSSNIAMLDHNGLHSIGDGANGTVALSLALPDGQVLVAGSFTSISNQPCGFIAKAWPLLDVEVTRQPVDQAVAAGSTATFSLQAVQQGSCPTPIALQWQRRDPRVADPNASDAWIDLVDDGNFVNTTEATFSILNPTAALATGFRCRIQGCSCKNAIYSDEVNFSIACPADFNADGGVDFTDVEAFFERWENGC